MATQDLEKLVVQLTADFKSFEREMAKAQGVTTRELRKIEKQADSSLTRINKGMRSLGAGILAGVGIAGVQQLAQALQGVVGEAAKIGDLADRTGLTTAAIQGLQTAAAEADLDMAGLTKTLLKFSAVLGEAKTGQGQFLETLKGLGLEVKGNTLDNLRQLADVIAGLNDENQQLFVLRQALGKGSDAYLEIFRKGARGIDEMIVATKGLSDESIRTAQTIDDKLAVSILNLGRDAKDAVIEALKWFKLLDENIPTPQELGKTAADWVRSLVPATSALGQLIAAQDAVKKGAIASPEMKPPTFTNAPRRTFTLQTKEEEDALTKAQREQEKALKSLNDEREREQEILAGKRASFFEDIGGIRENTEALTLEAELIGKSTAEVEKARAAQELLNSARASGIEITAGVADAIDATAAAYGNAAAELERLQETQATAIEVNDALKSTLTGIATDLRAGVEPIEALTNAFDDLLGKLLEIVLNAAIQKFFKTALGGDAGGLGGTIAALIAHKGGVVGKGGAYRSISPAAFAGAQRLHNGGIAGNEQAAILERGEVVLPKGFKIGGGGQIVNIYNQAPGVTVDTRRKNRGDDRSEVDIMIKAVNQIITEGRADAAMRGRFGARPSARQR